jgi:hypothetical protein
MAHELPPIDISAMPELAQLADEVARTRRPRPLCRGSTAIAVLYPTPVKPPAPRSARLVPAARGIAERTAGASITEQTAGIFRQYRLASPLTPRQEHDAFEKGVAEEVSGTRGD